MNLLDRIDKTCAKLGLQIVVNAQTGECRVQGDPKFITPKLRELLKEAKPLLLERAGYHQSAIAIEAPPPPKEIPTNVCLAFSEGYWPTGHDNRLKQCPKCRAKYCESCQFRFDYKCPKCGVGIP